MARTTPEHYVHKTSPQMPFKNMGSQGIEDELAAFYRNARVDTTVSPNYVEGADVSLALQRIARWNGSGDFLPFGYSFEARAEVHGKEKKLPKLEEVRSRIISIDGFVGGGWRENVLYDTARNISAAVAMRQGNGRNEMVYTGRVMPASEVPSLEEMLDHTLPTGIDVFNTMHPEMPVRPAVLSQLSNIAYKASVDMNLLPTPL